MHYTRPVYYVIRPYIMHLKALIKRVSKTYIRHLDRGALHGLGLNVRVRHQGYSIYINIRSMHLVVDIALLISDFLVYRLVAHGQ